MKFGLFYELIALRPHDAAAEQRAYWAVVCIGDPQRCIEVIKHWEAVGVDQIMCLMQAGRIPHAKVMESIRLFGEHIIPFFNKRAGEQPLASVQA